MSTKRQTISPEKKFKIVVEILHGQQTLNEIASKYKVHPTLITRWKKHFFESAPRFSWTVVVRMSVMIAIKSVLDWKNWTAES